MKQVGSGRIVFWEGASLWAFDVPPATTDRRGTDAHAHHAIQVTFAVEGRFTFHIGSEVVDGPAVLIAPNVSHAYFPQGRNAMIFVDPESRLGSAVLRDLAGRSFSRPGPEVFADIAAGLTCIWEDPRPDDATLVKLGRRLAARLADIAAGDRPIDKRIARVLARLVSELPGDFGIRLSAGAAADIACLSESRFSHLFVDEIGLPYRTYVLWRRMIIAVTAIAAGTNLTSAAHDAGFADSAHFSRTFLRMFGIPASLLLMI